MPKQTITITRDGFQPPRDKEVSAFTHMMQQPTGKAILARLGVHLPSTFDLTHNTAGDDPPDLDLEVFHIGFEHTEFPPNQSARNIAFILYSGAMAIPPFHAARSPKAILDYAHANELGDENTGQQSDYIPSGMNPVDDEIAALEKAFLEMVAAKDVSGNDVLILDGRADFTKASIVATAIQRGLAKHQPVHFKMIVLVRTASYEMYPALDEAVMISRP